MGTALSGNEGQNDMTGKEKSSILCTSSAKGVARSIDITPPSTNDCASIMWYLNGDGKSAKQTLTSDCIVFDAWEGKHVHQFG